MGLGPRLLFANQWLFRPLVERAKAKYPQANAAIRTTTAATMFNAANTEHFALYAKLRPFLSDIRAASSYPDYLLHVEKVVHTEADPESRISIFARYMERQRKLAADGRQRSYLTKDETTVADQRTG